MTVSPLHISNFPAEILSHELQTKQAEGSTMHDERDEANLIGQVAGIIAVMSAIADALPISARKRFQQQLHIRFGALLDAMSKSGNAEAGIEGAEWVRELFLKQVANSISKPKNRKTRSEANISVDIEL